MHQLVNLPSNYSRKRISFSSTASGFALVLALSMMSFLLLITLTITSLVRLEFLNSEICTAQLLTKQNARLGVMVALGNLQRYAALDQRVTARADILGPGQYAEQCRYWTGVWDASSGAVADPLWLVSGEQPDPRVGPGDRFIEMVPAGADSPAVSVVPEAIGSSSAEEGSFAYFVSDESIKASVQGARDAVVQFKKAKFNNQRRATEYQVPFGADLGVFIDGKEFHLDDVNLAASLARVRSLEDLSLLQDSNGATLVNSSRQLGEFFHHLAPLSFGVLENSLAGGLRTNLSDRTYRDNFLANDELMEFLQPKTSGMLIDSGRINARKFSGKPVHSPRPLLTEVVLYVGLFHTQSDSNLRVRYHAEAEFVNPYSVPLQFPMDQDSRYNRGLVLYFENLPTLTVSAPSAPTITENLNQFASYGVSDPRRYISSWFDISSFSKRNQPELLPGETYRVIEPNPRTQKRGLARDFGLFGWSGASQPDDSENVTIRATHSPRGVSIVAVPYERSGDMRRRDPIFRIDGLQFDDFEIIKKYNSGPNPFSRSTSSSYVREDYLFAYHFRIKSDESALNSMRDVLTAVDLRDSNINFSRQAKDIEGREIELVELLDPVYSDPSYIIQDPVNLFSMLDQSMDLTQRSHKDDYRMMLLYDVPQEEVLSVGQLSNLHLYRRQPRSIGNPWGGDYNEAFDQYYFSPKNVTDDGFAYRGNVALLGLIESPQIASTEDATDELIASAFNINSTSEIAWQAVLSSPVLTPEALDENLRGRADVSRPGSFFRLPHYQATEDDFFVSTSRLTEPDNFFKQGIRSLHGEVGDAQIRELSGYIVKAIEQRGEPFPNLKTFVNSGILHNAIVSVGTGDTSTTEINEDLMEFSNLHLIQSDIMAKLAPSAVVRADTFRIRASGSVVNPATGKSSKPVFCEALVQRLPQRLGNADPMQPANTVGSGRRFQIIDFDWIELDV